ncbi:cadherin-related family member 5 [Trichomycterus rosablanca]|uniref:cadherin-related family member 5 n=1 Tax=Trichomycterus rosablanca TaxID=2290929 RepID=UPI002F350A8A
MDPKHLIFVKIVCYLLAACSINITLSQEICTAPITVDFPENNTIGDEVTPIYTEPGVSLEITENPEGAFGINGTLLVALKVLDFETLPDGGGLRVSIKCSKEGITKHVIVIVQNINDNPPVFSQDLYNLKVNELSPDGTPVDKIEATDLDKQRLYYVLESPMGEFGLQSVLNPEIVVRRHLDYDTLSEVTLQLFAQDTPLFSSETPSHTATTTVIIEIVDINNRPPWFQPCTETIVGLAKVCISSGYTGIVSKETTGALTLEPGPLYSIDGDKGINDPIGYKIVGGNDNDIFSINANSGNITMQKPVDVAGPIILTVLAYETNTPDQFATTTVTFQVVNMSENPPQFVKPSYEGFISEDAGVGSLVLERKSSNKPLQVQATDADFFDGINPYLKFDITEGNEFKITAEGFILMTRIVTPGTVKLQMRVVDTTNGESDTASLAVEVIPGIPTTMDMSTTILSTSVPVTTDISTSTAITTDTITDSSITTDMTESTFNPETVTTVPYTTPSPYTELLIPSGKFKTEDMIALGVSLAVALLLCFVIIGLLAFKVKQYRSNWRKLSEASIFQSALSGRSGGPKDGVHYTNGGFQNDEDTDSISSKQEAKPAGLELSQVQEIQDTQSSAPASQNKSNDDDALSDSSSQNASDNTDSEKEVKPILTKERRTEEGYKAVWFKEDIDPNDKEEVVIPESEEQEIGNEDDADDDDENDKEDDDEDDYEEEEEESNIAAL